MSAVNDLLLSQPCSCLPTPCYLPPSLPPSTHREHWYGILYSQTSSTKKSNLLLSVLYRNADVPWLGPFSYLGPRPVTGVTDPRRAAGAPPSVPLEQEKNPFPVPPPRLPSFQTPNSLLWASEMVLQVCVCMHVCVYTCAAVPITYIII